MAINATIASRPLASLLNSPSTTWQPQHTDHMRSMSTYSHAYIYIYIYIYAYVCVHVYTAAKYVLYAKHDISTLVEFLLSQAGLVSVSGDVGWAWLTV